MKREEIKKGRVMARMLATELKNVKGGDGNDPIDGVTCKATGELGNNGDITQGISDNDGPYQI